MAQLEGFTELQRQLTELGDVAGGRALRSALMTAALPALRNIQAAAPIGSKAHRTYMGRLVAPGFLSRNIRRKSLLSRDKSHATVLIGPASEAFYAKFLEFGKTGYSARPFMEPAFRSSQDQVIARLKDRLGILIEKSGSQMILTSLYQFLSSRSPQLCQAIYREQLPQEHPLPAITFELDSDDDVQLLDGTQGSLHESLVTLNCYDPSALTADALAAAVKNALVGYTGTFGSFTAQCIYKESEGSAPETVTGLRGVSLQFFIAYF